MSFVRNINFWNCLWRKVNLKQSQHSFPAEWISRQKFSTTSLLFSDDSKNKQELTDSSVFVQDGLFIQELPFIVRILHGEFIVHERGTTNNGIYRGLELEALKKYKENDNKRLFDEEFEQEVSNYFKKCKTLKDFYLVLDTIHPDSIDGVASLIIIKILIQIENNRKYRSNRNSLLPEENQEIIKVVKVSDEDLKRNSITFTRSAIMEKLVGNICATDNSDLVLNTMKALRKDTSVGDRGLYAKQLCDKCLILISDGRLKATEIASLAQNIHIVSDQLAKEYCDKLWVGLENSMHELNEIEIVDIFAMIPYVNKSRSYVFRLAEKRALLLWNKFAASEVIQIVSILSTSQCNSHKLLKALSKWLNLNIHTLDESKLRWILLAFTKLRFLDEHLEKSLEKYCKARVNSMQDPELVGAIADYCSTLRLRNEHILEACAQFFILKGKSLNIGLLWTICNPLGVLCYVPKKSFEYFQILEETLLSRFASFPPDLLLDILLKCVYLERYPLNFSQKIFHPNFFKRIEELPSRDIKKSFAKLRVLDRALTLESSCYLGPVMIKTALSASLWMQKDIRITRSTAHFVDAFKWIAGDEGKISTNIIPLGFPLQDIYKVDCLVEHYDAKHGLPKSDLPLAYFLQVPEHYDIKQEYLNGVYKMRERHLKLSGYNVININYENLQCFYNNIVGAKKFILDETRKSLNMNYID